jgi:hypothetical protein
LLDGTCDEDKFGDPNTGRFDSRVIARRIRWWMIVSVASEGRIRVWMDVPAEITTDIVALLKMEDGGRFAP